MASQCIPATIV